MRVARATHNVFLLLGIKTLPYLSMHASTDAFQDEVMVDASCTL